MKFDRGIHTVYKHVFLEIWLSNGHTVHMYVSEFVPKISKFLD